MIETGNLQSIEVTNIPPARLETLLADRMNRAILYDMCISELLTELNNSEAELKPEYVAALSRTTSFIRKNVYHAFSDILDFGSTTLIKQTVNILEVCRKYQNHEIQDIQVQGNPSVALKAITGYITNIQADNYHDKYLKQNWGP